MLNTDVLRIEPLPVLEGKPLVSGDKVTLYGFGNNEEYAQPGKVSDLYFLGKSADTGVGRFFNGVFEISYLENLVGICPGDQGGPAISVENGVSVVVGVMAYGEGYIDQYGRCVTGALDRNGVVDLQSQQSSRFLASFPRVKRYKYVAPTPVPTPTPAAVQNTPLPTVSINQISFQSRVYLRRAKVLLKNTSGSAFVRRVSALRDEIESLATVSPQPQNGWLLSAVDALDIAAFSRDSGTRLASLKRVVKLLRQTTVSS